MIEVLLCFSVNGGRIINRLRNVHVPDSVNTPLKLYIQLIKLIELELLRPASNINYASIQPLLNIYYIPNYYEIAQQLFEQTYYFHNNHSNNDNKSNSDNSSTNKNNDNTDANSNSKVTKPPKLLSTNITNTILTALSSVSKPIISEDLSSLKITFNINQTIIHNTKNDNNSTSTHNSIENKEGNVDTHNVNNMNMQLSPNVDAVNEADIEAKSISDIQNYPITLQRLGDSYNNMLQAMSKITTKYKSNPSNTNSSDFTSIQSRLDESLLEIYPLPEDLHLSLICCNLLLPNEIADKLNKYLENPNKYANNNSDNDYNTNTWGYWWNNTFDKFFNKIGLWDDDTI